MRLNFFLEGAGLIVCIILWIACSIRYNMVDLKDKIYVYMVRIVTVLLAFNIIACFIVRNNVFGMIGVAEFIICLSFWTMVWIWFYINIYLLEIVYNRNAISVQTHLIVSLPSFFNLLLLIINWGIHKVFDVSKVEGTIQIVFNSWYKLPYILAIFSFVIYLVILVRNHRQLCDKKQYVFFAVPLIMFVSYYIQYHFKAVAVLGFGYAVILLLLYLYSYNYIVRMDALTRLPNGDLFKKMIDYRIGSNQPMAVALIALNDFKRINNEYGYYNGHQFIQEVGKYLEEVSPKKCIARYGGDMFGVVLDNFSEEEITNWYEAILERFESAWHVGKLAHKITVCITIVQYPDMADQSTEILELLNYLHMYIKGDRKSQCVICNETFKKRMQRRIRITSILREVIQDKKMYVKYQPILNVTENMYSRGEALFYLKDDLLGEIPSHEFLPIAEENGDIVEIGYVLIDKVCQYIKTFIERGEAAPIISVNFSRQQIMTDDVEERILEVLQKYDLSPENIAIELQEDVFSLQYGLAKERLEKMVSHGFRFYLDGFGIGFLDLSHWMELPFEMIKINKSMIRDAENNDTIYLLVSALAAVFEENGKLILGDGIASEHLKELADMLFMDYLQGSYFSEPIAGEKARKEFERRDIVENIPDITQVIAASLEEK